MAKGCSKTATATATRRRVDCKSHSFRCKRVFWGLLRGTGGQVTGVVNCNMPSTVMSRFTCKCSSAGSHAPLPGIPSPSLSQGNNNDHDELHDDGDSGDDLIKTWKRTSKAGMQAAAAPEPEPVGQWEAGQTNRQPGRQAGRHPAACNSSYN